MSVLIGVVLGDGVGLLELADVIEKSIPLPGELEVRLQIHLLVLTGPDSIDDVAPGRAWLQVPYSEKYCTFTSNFFFTKSRT